MPFNPLYCTYGKYVIPQRVILAIMLHLSMQNAYNLRVAINIAITEMVVQTKKNSTFDDCPNIEYEKDVATKEGKYVWDSGKQGLIKYMFFIGYFIGHLPGGWLSDKIGARHVLGTGLLIAALCSMLHPITIVKGGEYYGLIWCVLLRFIIGLAQAPICPTISSFLGAWAPKNERAVLGGIAFGGGNLGNIMGFIVTGVVIHHTESWGDAFYLWGGLTIAWYILFLLTSFSFPETHPFITEKEKAYLLENTKKPTDFKVPWLKIAKSCPVWAILAAQWGHDYVLFVMNTDLPKFVKDYLKMQIKKSGIMSALPFICCWVCVLMSGWIGDVLINKKVMSVLTMRKSFTIISIIVPAICNVAAVYIGCSRILVVFLYSFGMFWMGPFWSALKVNVNDISVHYGGIIQAIVNGLGAIAGIVGPLLTGAITTEGSLAQWRIIFWIMMGIAVFTSLIYLFFASATRQDWDFWEGEEKEEKTT